MREEELIALLPTITEELTAPQFRNDLEQLDFTLADLLAEFSELPEHSTVSAEEWEARRTDFCNAAKLYLDGRWKQQPAAKAH
jgi:hypothetical protein